MTLQAAIVLLDEHLSLHELLSRITHSFETDYLEQCMLFLILPTFCTRGFLLLQETIVLFRKLPRCKNFLS